jgi:hypothetical protein
MACWAATCWAAVRSALKATAVSRAPRFAKNDFLTLSKASLQRSIPPKRRFFAYKTLSVFRCAFIFLQ